jgi:hypothetical protein
MVLRGDDVTGKCTTNALVKSQVIFYIAIFVIFMDASAD